MPQPLKSVDGKTAGFIKGKIFFKKVKASIHQLRTPAGYAIDAVIYESLYNLGIEEIRLYETEHGNTYVSSLNNYQIHRFLIERHNYGKQWGLAMKFWTVERTDLSELAALMAKS
jgi:hypothetical protein